MKIYVAYTKEETSYYEEIEVATRYFVNKEDAENYWRLTGEEFKEVELEESFNIEGSNYSLRSMLTFNVGANGGASLTQKGFAIAQIDAYGNPTYINEDKFIEEDNKLMLTEYDPNLKPVILNHHLGCRYDTRIVTLDICKIYSGKDDVKEIKKSFVEFVNNTINDFEEEFKELKTYDEFVRKLRNFKK